MDTEQITGVMPTLALWVTEFGLKAAEQARRALSELRRRADRPAASRSAPARALPRRDRAHLEAERVRGGSALNVQRALLVRHCESSGQAPDARLTARGIDARFGFAGWQALSNPDVHALEANATTGLAFRRVWG